MHIRKMLAVAIGVAALAVPSAAYASGGIDADVDGNVCQNGSTCTNSPNDSETTNHNEDNSDNNSNNEANPIGGGAGSGTVVSGGGHGEGGGSAAASGSNATGGTATNTNTNTAAVDFNSSIVVGGTAALPAATGGTTVAGASDTPTTVVAGASDSPVLRASRTGAALPFTGAETQLVAAAGLLTAMLGAGLWMAGNRRVRRDVA